MENARKFPRNSINGSRFCWIGTGCWGDGAIRRRVAAFYQLLVGTSQKGCTGSDGTEFNSFIHAPNVSSTIKRHLDKLVSKIVCGLGGLYGQSINFLIFNKSLIFLRFLNLKFFEFHTRSSSRIFAGGLYQTLHA